MNSKNKKGASVPIHSVVVVIMTLMFLAVAFAFISGFGSEGLESISTSVCHSMLLRRAGVSLPRWEPGFWEGIVVPDKTLNKGVEATEDYTKDTLAKSCRPIEVDCKGPADEVALCLYDKMSTAFYVLLGGFPSDAPYTNFDLFKINVDVAGDGVIDLKGSCENYAGAVYLSKWTSDDPIGYNFNSEEYISSMGIGIEAFIHDIHTYSDEFYVDSYWKITAELEEDVICSEQDFSNSVRSVNLQEDEYACIKTSDENYIKLHYITTTQDGTQPAEFYWDWERKTEGADNYRKYNCSNPDEDLEDLNICYKERTDKDTNEKTCRIKFTHIDYFTMGLSMIEECQLKGISSSACKCFAKEEEGYHPGNGLPLGTRFRLEFEGICNSGDNCYPIPQIPSYYNASEMDTIFKNYSEYPKNYGSDYSNYQGCGWEEEPAVISDVILYARSYEDCIRFKSNDEDYPPHVLKSREIWPPNRLYGIDDIELSKEDPVNALYVRLNKKNFFGCGFLKEPTSDVGHYEDFAITNTVVQISEDEK